MAQNYICMNDINTCLPNPCNFPYVIPGSLKPFPYAYLYLVYVGTLDIIMRFHVLSAVSIKKPSAEMQYSNL